MDRNIIDPGTYSNGGIIADLKGRADIIDQVSDTEIYFGFCKKGTANPATDEAAELWSILKIEITGTFTRFKWAHGQAIYNLIWNARTIYPYQYKTF